MSKVFLKCDFCFANNEQFEDAFFFRLRQLDGTAHVICDDCLSSIAKQAVEIKQQKIRQKTSDMPILYPKQIVDHLNRFVVGQDIAKQTLAVAVFQHYAQFSHPELNSKSNVLIAGPTGSGKTELIRVIAKFLNVPFVTMDMTTITPRGYVGDSPEVCVEKLLTAAKGNVGLAEKGIIFLDEFDKIPSGSSWDSFKAKSVQQEILKIIEGDSVDVKINAYSKASVNTSKVLFIVAGSFIGLEKIVENDNPKSLGFAASFTKPEQNSEQLAKKVQLRHFEKFGLIPEILGRLPVICFTNQLTEDNLYHILTETEDSVTDYYKKLFSTYGVSLSISDEFLRKICRDALSMNLGARGLKKVLEDKLKDVLFMIDSLKGKAISLLPSGELEIDDFPGQVSSAAKLS